MEASVASMLAECGKSATGEGLIADAKALAKVVGVPFTTLKETVDLLKLHFGKTPASTPEAADWETRVVEANAQASAFSEDDDTLARQLLERRS